MKKTDSVLSWLTDDGKSRLFLEKVTLYKWLL